MTQNVQNRTVRLWQVRIFSCAIMETDNARGLVMGSARPANRRGAHRRPAPTCPNCQSAEHTLTDESIGTGFYFCRACEHPWYAGRPHPSGDETSN